MGSANFNYNRIDMFDSAGNFLSDWGKDVVSAGPGNTGTRFEICVAANGDTCKPGDFASTLGGELRDPVGVVTDSAGNLYVADLGRERIQKFTNPVLPPPGLLDPAPSNPLLPSNAFTIIGVKGKKLILNWPEPLVLIQQSSWDYFVQE